MIKDIAVLLVTYKFPQGKLQKLLKSLQNQGVQKKSMYVKDNTANNIGYAGAINSILKKIISQYTYFLILNPDIHIERDCIKNLLTTISSNKKIGIVGPRMIRQNNKTFVDGGSLDGKRFSSILQEKRESHKKIELTPVRYVSGSAMLIKKDVFKTIGLFKDDYFVYYEDVDFCMRAHKAGYQVCIDPKARIIHDESQTVGKESPFMEYYMARNHLLFVQRFAPWFVQVRELIRLPKTLFEARYKKFELLGIADFFLRRFGRRKNIYTKADLL